MGVRDRGNAQETGPRARLGRGNPVVSTDNVSLQTPADRQGEIASGYNTGDVNKITLIQDLFAKIEGKNFRSLCNEKLKNRCLTI